MNKVDKILSTYFDEVKMRKTKNKSKFRIKNEWKNKEIRVASAAIDYYKTFYKDRTALDLVVDLYDSIIKIVNRCEKNFGTYGGFNRKVKLLNLPDFFEISAWTEQDYTDESIKTTVFVNVKGSTVLITCKQVENEITERFLRDIK